MQCFRPLTITNPLFDEEGNFQNSALHRFITVPCGKCAACIVSSANEWRVRLQEELAASSTAYFVTLTYDDSHLFFQKCAVSDGVSASLPVVSKYDIQCFFKRLRKHLKGTKIRYFLVSEYGPSTLRPHYHCIIFNLPRKSLDSFSDCALQNKELRRIWNNGNVLVDPVTFGRISYVTKYICSVTNLPEYLPRPFRLMSRRPAIGSTYLLNKSRIEWHRSTLSNFYPFGNSKQRLPRYYRDRIFDDAMLLEIKERNQDSMRHDYTSLRKSAVSLGYKDETDLIRGNQDAFQRKFDRIMVKSRKDI